MDQRQANSLIMTVNEKKFIESALLSDIRVDGRRPFDYRNLTISEDGSSEVQLGHTQVIGFVSAQLIQPYRDRPTEGTFAIYIEFSPMADPSFEAGRPGETAVELGQIVDRGLRESRAIDTESLCVVAGKLVWSIRIDLHIIDNGGNLVDAANIAALAALSTFRRPECTFGGEDGQEVIVNPPDLWEPLPLIIHHLPVAVTFGFIGKENNVVIDPTHYEEAVMGGSMTATLNTNGDICAIQKAGGDGVLQSVIMQCLRIASVKAGDITSKIKNAVEAYNTQRSLRKIKRHDPLPDEQGSIDVAKYHMERLTLGSDVSTAGHSNMEIGSQSNERDETNKKNTTAKGFSGRPASWDPYSRGVDGDALKASLASRVTAPPDKHIKSSRQVKADVAKSSQRSSDTNSFQEAKKIGLQTDESKTLKDAVKPRQKRRINKSTSNSAAT
ncbi:exosome complex component RRP45A-like isoform X2 [Cynara cardunculus var. scolymus]|uniref:exosome complex component RRP45A-like isoform X2 n=1 Tax=Cynara cardunculus var. scolymus TaxID=59895 RepID=UPI000D629375|nr:exosome complex component RRP45A-like isoform X2 [Cynara cardunculus var. scolymus]